MTATQRPRGAHSAHESADPSGSGGLQERLLAGLGLSGSEYVDVLMRSRRAAATGAAKDDSGVPAWVKDAILDPTEPTFETAPVAIAVADSAVAAFLNLAPDAIADGYHAAHRKYPDLGVDDTCAVSLRALNIKCRAVKDVAHGKPVAPVGYAVFVIDLLDPSRITKVA
ncbi:hypothetical protein [Sinomonas sp. ASV322]|uniref:hypothetical protein n=1 Tax=Sinomonas sp. ASV322 TaxID=3041920 RepID=UPI0027DE1431|nr:hypothetical protein [Sinomonas sp. ASV322]MDQ4503890.1 hypothetical protein [Sinomonas sp. ASV322]